MQPNYAGKRLLAKCILFNITHLLDLNARKSIDIYAIRIVFLLLIGDIIKLFHYLAMIKLRESILNKLKPIC